MDKETCSRIIAVADYSLLADETTDVADRAVLSIFIRYVNSNTHKVKEGYLGLVETIGSKGAGDLCQDICDVLHLKDIVIKQLCFHGLDSTNAITGQHTGLQRRLKHEAPHSEYMNCQNYRLVLVFVHLDTKVSITRRG